MSVIGRGFVYLALAMMILPQGATSPIAFYLACIPVGIAASLATITPPDAPSARRSFNLCFGFAIILAAYVLFQAWSFPGNPFANPIWAKADMLVGVATRAISVEPSTTAMATITLLSPFLLYASSLAFFDSDKRALGLVKLIAAIGIAFAVFGLVQIWFLPHSLLLSRKIYYLDSLTSVFVNRNTAGTFLGVASLAVLAQIVAVIQEIEHPAPLRRLLSLDDKEISDQRLRGGLWVVGLIACLLALFLTRSRGALLSTLVAYISAMPLLAAHLAGRFRRFGGATEAADASKRRWKAFSRTMIVAAIVLFVAALLGGRALLRLEQHPVDEARLLDALSEAGGISTPSQETFITLQRNGTTATVPFEALSSDPKENIYLYPGDTLLANRDRRTFLAFGASGLNGRIDFEDSNLTLAEAVGKAGGLLDSRADPAEVFLYRRVPAHILAEMGTPVSIKDGGDFPVIIRANMRDPSTFFLAQRFPMKDKDILYVSNADSVELLKVLNIISSATSGVAGPAADVVTVRNATR